MESRQGKINDRTCYKELWSPAIVKVTIIYVIKNYGVPMVKLTITYVIKNYGVPQRSFDFVTFFFRSSWNGYPNF